MMEEPFALGARLSACAGMVREGRALADIGTDHAYLPIWLVRTGKIPRAFASDINEEPIQLAKEHIRRYEIADKITTFTADGMEKIPPDEVDDIVIAGMGGDNIAGILEGAPWLLSPRYRLILQPMSKAERLRAYLYSRQFFVLEEKPICEANRIYTVICAEYIPEPFHYSDFDIYAGRLDKKNPYAAALLQRQAGILRDMADGCAARHDDEGEKHFRTLAGQLLR